MATDADDSTLAAPAETRPPAVLQVVPTLVSGGVERGTVEMTAALVAAGWRAYVASAGGPMMHEVTRAGGVHLTLPVASKNPWVMRANVARLVEVIRRCRIDIVHARSRAPAWSAWPAARQTRRHFVTTFHNAYDTSTWLKRRYNAVMAQGERVIAISDFVAEHVAAVYGVGPERLRVIHRGVDIGRFDPQRVNPERVISLARAWRLPDGVPLVMLPGRLTRWKGHIELVEAMALLRDQETHCLVVGSGDARYRREVADRIAQRGLGARFQFVDECRDMPAALMLADVVVSASTSPEGFGRVIVEAQAMGRPVVATDHGGARETVLPGETGWLVPPGDPAALAEAIAQALALAPEERLALAEREIDHVRRCFTTAAMTDREIALYEEILFPEPLAQAIGDPLPEAAADPEDPIAA